MLDIKSVAPATKYGSLSPREATRPRLQAAKVHDLGPIDCQLIKEMAPIAQSHRSVSCFELGSDKRRYRTIRIGEDSEELQQLAQANVSELLKTASCSEANNALLARKALRFRKISTSP